MQGREFDEVTDEATGARYPLPEELAREAARTWFFVGLVLGAAAMVAWLSVIAGRP